MNLQIRPAQLKDLGAIEALYREHAQTPENGFAATHALPRRQFASSRLWFLVNNTFASILPLTSPADHVFVAEGPRQSIQAFVQAENGPAGKHVWQILNLSVRPDLDRFEAGTALLDHLFNEGLQRGVYRYVVRVSVDDPMTDLFKARGFRAYATEHALLAEGVAERPLPQVAGWRPMRREDELAVYLLYRATTPKEVSAVEAGTFREWRQNFHHGSWTSRLPRPSRQRQFVIDRVQVMGWMGITPGSGARPNTLGLLALPDPPALAEELVERSLGYLAANRPGPVWCSLRHYDQRLVQMLQREGFEVIASQVLMVRDLALKVPVRARSRVKDKALVPQYG
jgi:ribosomal protein S18 acetylase RimI-like enzyme